MQETKFDIYEVIGDLRVSEVVKQTMVQLIQRKKKGDEEAANRLCKIASVLRNQGNITSEQQLQIIVFARQKEPQKSGNGFWTACKCWLKRFFWRE